MEEEREEGELNPEVLTFYIRAGGSLFALLWLFAIIRQQSSQLLAEAWLATLASGSGLGIKPTHNYGIEFCFGIYAGLALCQGVCLFTRTFISTWCAPRRHP